MARLEYIESVHIFGAVLTAMRETAYGSDTIRATNKVLDRAERMRDDDKLIFLAEEKRKAKQAKRLAQAHKLEKRDELQPKHS